MSSERYIPLVGSSKQARQRVIEAYNKGKITNEELELLTRPMSDVYDDETDRILRLLVKIGVFGRVKLDE